MYNLHRFDDLHHITLMLGRQCNMSCPHCNQHIPEQYNDDGYINEEVLEWLKSWADNAKKSRYEHSIMFWGGEPLVYWNKIKAVVSAIPSHIKFVIYTNGKAFTQEIMTYMEEHEFSLIMSYDLPNPTIIRSEAPSGEAIELFNSYKGSKKIHSIYNALTPSLANMYEVGDKIFPNTKITFGFIRDTIGTPEELIAYEDGKIERDMQSLWEYYELHKERNEIKNFFANSGRAKTKRYELKNKWSEMTLPQCTSGYSNIAIDIEGNVYTCQNTYNIVANILKSDFNTIQDLMMKKRYELLPNKCKKCEMSYYCPSSCLTYRKSGDCITQCEFIKLWKNEATKIYQKYIQKVGNNL